MTRPSTCRYDRLRPYYPNLLGLRSEWMQSRPPSAEGKPARTLPFRRRQRPFHLRVLFSQICGREATEEDRAVFLRAAAATRGREPVKPLSIAMQAFGPYLHEAAVDFTRLGDSRLSSSPARPAAARPPARRHEFALCCRATGGSPQLPICATSPRPTICPRVDFVFLLRGETYRYPLAAHSHRARHRPPGIPRGARLLPKGGGGMEPSALGRRGARPRKELRNSSA